MREQTVMRFARECNQRETFDVGTEMAFPDRVYLLSDEQAGCLSIPLYGLTQGTRAPVIKDY
jgi:hypothetical protein